MTNNSKKETHNQPEKRDFMSHVYFPSHRSGRRIRKTRKYDIITTPAERVEMAPLNEENDDEDDSTLFDVNYRFVPQDILNHNLVFLYDQTKVWADPGNSCFLAL